MLEVEKTVWRLVVDMTTPAPEPFGVIEVDLSRRDEEGRIVGTVLSLHMLREEAEKIVHEFDNGGMLDA